MGPGARDQNSNTPPRGNLREAHAHLASLGESLTIPSLAACSSLSECLDSVRRAATGPDPFVRLASARIAGWSEGRWPTLAELDAATVDKPCVIMSFDHHAAVANTAAMRAAGLTPGQQVGANGLVEVDEHAQPTGLLIEDAAYTAWRSTPEPSHQTRRDQLRQALAHLHALGFTEVHDLHSEPTLGPLLAELDRADELRLTTWLYPPVARIQQEAAARSQWESAKVRLAGAKIFADGTLNSRTASMLHRYAQPLLGHPRGQCMFAPTALDAALRELDTLGLPVAVHAIGDCAVRSVLDSIQRVHADKPDPGATRAGIGRHRIEHCEIIDARDVPRFAKLGVIASVQPCHLLADVEALNKYVPHRLDRVLPLRELIDSGCKPGPSGLLWFGSDVPIVPADPADSIQAAVHRRRAGRPPEEAIAPAQAITEAEAWAAFAAPTPA